MSKSRSGIPACHLSHDQSKLVAAKAKVAKNEKRPKRTKINPAFKAGEKARLDRHWRNLFLDSLAETSNVSEAARRAGINPSRAYKVRREEIDFARQWHRALMEGYEHLELEVLARLRAGEPKDGPKYDNASALRLLALHRDTMAQEHSQRQNMDAASARAIIDAKLEELRQRVIARRIARTRAVQGDTVQ